MCVSMGTPRLPLLAKASSHPWTAIIADPTVHFVAGALLCFTLVSICACKSHCCPFNGTTPSARIQFKPTDLANFLIKLFRLIFYKRRPVMLVRFVSPCLQQETSAIWQAHNSSLSQYYSATSRKRNSTRSSSSRQVNSNITIFLPSHSFAVDNFDISPAPIYSNSDLSDSLGEPVSGVFRPSDFRTTSSFANKKNQKHLAGKTNFLTLKFTFINNSTFYVFIFGQFKSSKNK